MSNKKQHTSIFKTGRDYQFNAIFHHHHDGLKAYTYAYAETISVLFRKVLEEEPGIIDFTAYPLLFLCRHFFEIQFKLITYLDIGKYDKHHKLSDLWNSAKTSMKNRWPNANEPEEFAKIEQIIREFDAIDFNSMAFRYSHDKAGKIHLEKKTHINLRAFYEELYPLVNFLECVSDGWSQ